MFKNILTISLIFFLLSLSACGGGGGSTAGFTPPVATCTSPQVLTNGVCTTPSPTVSPANLQISVPIPTYAAATEELAAFSEFNAFRKMMGLGLVAQNLKLDTAAKNHANYIVVNQIFAHIEDSAKPGFTGVNPQDRAQFAGYTGNDGELISTTGGLIGVRALMNTLYHRDGIASQPILEVGFALNAGWNVPLVVELGLAGKGQNNASDFVTTYPIDTQTDLPLTMMVESPNPFSDLSTANSDFPTKTSSPVSLYSAFGTTLSVTSFTVTQVGQSTPLPMRLITAASDVNKAVQGNVAHVVGMAPFAANTKFNVSFSGSVNGVAISRNWSFTTGTSLNIGGGANK